MLRYHCEVFTIYGCCIFVNALSTPPIGGSTGEGVNMGNKDIVESIEVFLIYWIEQVFFFFFILLQ